jgi:hypothetical protein
MTKPKPAKSGKPAWGWRRLIIFPVVTWGCYQLMLMINAPDTRVNEMIAYGWLVLIGILILGYTGFATVQDVIAIWRTGTGLPYKDPPAAIDGEPQPQPDPELKE